MRSPRTPRRLRNAATTAAAIVAISLLPVSAAFAAPAVVSGDDATPERVVLTPPQDPSTSQSITWRTGGSVTAGAVHIRAVGETTWRVVDARANEILQSAGIPTRTHSATIDGLTAATEYEYYVGTDGFTSDTFRFTTASAPGEDFTFIYFGDAQNELTAKWSPVVKAAYDRFPDAIGTVNAGDLVNRSGNDSEWTEWFGAMDGYSQTTNVIAAPGNHEYSGDAFLKNWKSNFEYPANGPAWDGTTGTSQAKIQEAAYRAHMEVALQETAYYTDYQGVRFISLNATINESLITPASLPPCLIACPDPAKLWLSMQADWLDDALTSNPNKWSAVVFHQPVFSTAEGRDEVDIRNAWLPVFQRNDIDLVLMGHDHTYARGYVNSDATATPGVTTGPVYAVSVSGPKYYEQQPVDDNVWTQNGATQVVRAGHTSTFQGIRVTDDQLFYEAVVAAKWDDQSTTDVPVGGVLDSFTITKYDNGTKFVTETGVTVPGPGEVEGPELPEEPGSAPATVPLGHEVVGTIDAATATAPSASAFDPQRKLLYVADQAGSGLIQAIDPSTGAVVREFSTGSPVVDMVYEPDLAGFSPAYPAVIVATEDDKIAGYSVHPSNFGTKIFEEQFTAGIRGVAIDQVPDLAYIALETGVIETYNFKADQHLAQTTVPADVQRLRLDPVTGNLYATFDSDTNGAVGLRIYATRSGVSELRSYVLDAGATSLDLDTTQGLVYVGHRTSGISVVDPVADTVARASEASFGASIEGVAVDVSKGLIYASSSSSQPAPIVVIGRQQAPRVVQSPTAATAEQGSPVTFEAHGFGVPTPHTTWESRASGAADWTVVDGAVGDSLEVVAGAKNVQYRAVFTNTIGGTDYRTTSASATLTVPSTVDRVFGANRFETAVEISKASYPTGAGVVYIANGNNYPDALSAGPAAAFEGGPLLLVTPDSLPGVVSAELARLAPERIVVVGGLPSVGAAVYDQLDALPGDITRLSGVDRYETSRLVADHAFGASGAERAYIATGTKFPDALMAGGAAGVNDAPVILVNGAAADLDAATATLLTELGITDTRVLGDTASVTAGLFEDVDAVTEAVRLAGANRYDTARAINADAFETAGRAFLATGGNYPDALAGSAWAGSVGAPLFAANTTCVPGGVLDDLEKLGVTHVTLLGGEPSLSASVLALTRC
ncbi:putative cell wall-binding protein [Leifsonia sp. AK011]|uniref:cell wall-binding repeat-containing protein n=1 Tax=Leifsonia sp. AK011 TaxID=2723075 RepID=UPI001793F310|nr:cell wall-binding repeat-containing protein [Leifsonia sp. AK011]NYF09152.1 putative cell wall-binding protein [Leifsonia sp. AK011]